MTQRLRWYDYISINIFFFALTFLSQTNGLVFPLLVQKFVGETTQGARFGELRLWSLMVALLWQAVVGTLSDRSTLTMGRRRPFIFIGTVGMLIFIALTGVASGMAGAAGFTFLFIIALLQSVAANTAHGAAQGLIPDLVPDEKRGRFSAIKAVLELPLPLILVSFTVAPLIKAGNYWLALGVAAGVLLVSMLLTLLARERPLQPGEVPPFDWSAILRLFLMAGVFTAIILGLGEAVRRLREPLAGLTSPLALILAMGLAGVLAMVVAVAVGVWVSVRISIGTAASRRNPSFTWWVVNRLAFLVGTTNLSSFAIYFLQGRLGLRGEAAAGPAARLVAVIGVFILLAALPSGILGDRFGHKRLVAISGVLAAAGVVIALLLPNLLVIYIGGSLIGIATGFFFTANWALGTRIVPQAEAGRYLGISNLAGAGAGAVGAYIGGPIADYVTAQLPGLPGAGYILLFAIYGLMFLVSLAALQRVQPPERAGQGEAAVS